MRIEPELLILRGDTKIMGAREETKMKQTTYGFTMLDIYEASGGLMYNGAWGEELSRSNCRCSDEPFEDITSEADWMIEARHLKTFLAASNDTLVEADAYTSVSNSGLKKAYRVSEIKSFVVYEDIGAIALFRRDDKGKFICQQIYCHSAYVAQDFWEAVYPDTYERAIAKVRHEFFYSEAFWYFVGDYRHILYKVTSDSIIAWGENYDENGEDATLSEGEKDGLNPDYSHEKDADHCSAYFDLEALKGTAYPQKKLDTPEALLAIAESYYSVEILLRDIHGAILTDDEYYCATTR